MRRRSEARARHKRLLTAGFMGGMVAGLVLWSLQLQRCRRELFSPRPLRRLAALGFLGGQADGAGVETAQLLGEYVRWEKHAGLRRRAKRLLDRVNAAL